MDTLQPLCKPVPEYENPLSEKAFSYLCIYLCFRLWPLPLVWSLGIAEKILSPFSLLSHKVLLCMGETTLSIPFSSLNSLSSLSFYLYLKAFNSPCWLAGSPYHRFRASHVHIWRAQSWTQDCRCVSSGLSRRKPSQVCSAQNMKYCNPACQDNPKCNSQLWKCKGVACIIPCSSLLLTLVCVPLQL